MFPRNNGSSQERNGSNWEGSMFNKESFERGALVYSSKETPEKNTGIMVTNPVILNPPREEMQLDQLPRHTQYPQPSIIKPTHIELLLFVNETTGDSWKRPALSGYLILDGHQTRVYLNEIKKNDKHFYKGEMSNPIFKQLTN